jgi:hypothetical protein
VLQALKVPKEQQDQLELKAQLALKEQQVHKEHKVL